LRRDFLREFFLRERQLRQTPWYDAYPAPAGWGGAWYEVYYNETTADFVLVCLIDWDTPAETNPKMWRFRLEEPHAAEKHGFMDLAEVMAFVQASLKESENDQGSGDYR
jgi:hypothetical protein